MTYPDMLTALLRIAHEAGEAILRVYQEPFTVTEKADHSPVTAADLAAHKVIVDGLAALPEVLPLISEEGQMPPWAERATWSRYWLIDPLDGTREFVKRNGEFTVNIALIEHHQPVLGVVHAPALQESWMGGSAVAAAWHLKGGAQTRIHARATPAVPVMALSRSHPHPALEQLLEGIPHEGWALGSSLKVCRIAEGRCDAYPKLGDIHEWDTAAAHAVLRGAGGELWRLADQRPVDYNQADSLLLPPFAALGSKDGPWQRWWGWH